MAIIMELLILLPAKAVIDDVLKLILKKLQKPEFQEILFLNKEMKLWIKII